MTSEFELSLDFYIFSSFKSVKTFLFCTLRHCQILPLQCFSSSFSLYFVLKTDFYIVCRILRQKKQIRPSFTMGELRDVMCSPLSFSEIIRLKKSRIDNLFLYILGVLPPVVSVAIMCLVGWLKKLI